MSMWLQQKLIQSKFMGKLSNVRHNPRKFLAILLPNNFFCTKLIITISRMINFKEYRYRKKMLMDLSLKPDKEQKANGYKILNLNNDNRLTSCISRCLELSSQFDFEKEALTSKKSFLIMKEINLKDPENIPILNMINHPELLATVANYLGMMPMVAYVAVWYSPNKHFESGRSQVYHFDGEDVAQMKCFIPLDIIDADTGPLTILPKQVSLKAYDDLKRKKIIKYNTQKVPDKMMYSVTDEKLAKPLLGVPGDVLLVDTCGCYHYGSRPASKHRLLLHIQFYTPFSRLMPLWHRVSHPELVALKSPDISDELYQALFGYTYLHRNTDAYKG